jgi:hypothetical protein
MESIYDVQLSFYKDMRLDVDFAGFYDLCYMAREMIYYNHWSNIVMNCFLESNDDIYDIIICIDIISCDEFLETGKF